MGEHADEAISNIFDLIEQYDYYSNTYNEYFYDEYGVPLIYDSSIKKKVITCKYCGKDNLKWNMTDKGWRLFDNCEQHRCHPADILRHSGLGK